MKPTTLMPTLVQDIWRDDLFSVLTESGWMRVDEYQAVVGILHTYCATSVERRALAWHALLELVGDVFFNWDTRCARVWLMVFWAAAFKHWK